MNPSSFENLTRTGVQKRSAPKTSRMRSSKCNKYRDALAFTTKLQVLHSRHRIGPAEPYLVQVAVLIVILPFTQFDAYFSNRSAAYASVNQWKQVEWSACVATLLTLHVGP